MLAQTWVLTNTLLWGLYQCFSHKAGASCRLLNEWEWNLETSCSVSEVLQRSHGNGHLESKGMASFNSSSENSAASYRTPLIANEAALTYKLTHWSICCLANFSLKNSWELMQNSHFGLFSKERMSMQRIVWKCGALFIWLVLFYHWSVLAVARWSTR